MNATEKVLLGILLAKQISSYLYLTNRVLKAIELSKEQLFLLDHKILKNAEKELVVSAKLEAYLKIFFGYSRTNQTRLAINSGRKILDLTRQNNWRKGEGVVTLELARLYLNDWHFNEAKEFGIKALSIATETGRKKDESDCYAILLVTFIYLGELVTAKEYGEKAIAIAQKIGKKTRTEAICYAHLGAISHGNREYVKAKEYKEKALEIAQEIGDRQLEAACYAGIADTLWMVNDHEYVKAKEFQEKALAIAQQIGDKKTEAKCYELLGRFSLNPWGPGNDSVNPKHYFERALVLRRETGDVKGEAKLHIVISGFCLLERNFPEAKLHFSAGIKQSKVFVKDEKRFLKDDDQSKIKYFDELSHIFPVISYMLCSSGNPREGLYTEEIGRARALEDLMSSQYSIENEISVSPETWVGIEKIMKKESNCVCCLYISYIESNITLFVVKVDNQVIAKHVNVTRCFAGKGSVSRVDDVFCSDIYRKVRCLAPEQCEDRSWFPSSIQQERKGESSQGNSLTAARLFEENENTDDQPPILTLADGYKMIIAPVADWLDKPEIIIVPDRLFFKLPFAALKDERGRCLSESFRIRVAPSLTTLQLIQDSPSDYHSQTGALIVGDPDVGEVLYKGNLHPIKRLPFAGEEAKMVRDLLGTQPLLGNKQQNRWFCKE